jgi:acyl-coenzyme A synthetase/AMP-(fatty) acid ligase/thioesterase domain-containing protein/acyl carrier protein
MTTTEPIFRSPHADRNGFQPREGFTAFAPAEAESTLGARFRAVAKRRAQAIAVVDGMRRVSYAELLDRAEAIGMRLRAECGPGGGIVGICRTGGLETVEAMLGALAGGFAYCCADPSLPPAQTAALWEAAAPLALLEGEECAVSPRPGGTEGGTEGPGGIAALYATSGSTGAAKLVALAHRAVLFDIGRQTNDLCLGPDDRFDSLFSAAFSASLATVFGALLNGAELHHHDPGADLPGLPRWLAGRRITVSTMTVSLLRHTCLAARTGLRGPVPRLLSAGGEALLAGDVEAFRSVFGAACVLQNAMASTETRTYAQYFVPPGGAVESPVPIGWAVAGKAVVLLGESGEAAGTDEGEIAIRSRYIAAGYVNDERLTAERFVPQPDGSVLYRTGDRGRLRHDGSLVFLGRTDRQVKVRGYRVEMDAVARAIEAHPRVWHAAVLQRTDARGNTGLTAYVVARPGAVAGEAELREFAATALPSYAVPSAFVFLAELPLNRNGKVDLRGLPVAPAPDPAPAAGASVEEALRGIWQETLERHDIPSEARFADLGGDSLAAVRVLLAIGERFGFDLEPETLVRFPTLRLLSAHLAGLAESGRDVGPVYTFQAGQDGCPVCFVAGLGGWASNDANLAEQIPARHPVYGLGLRRGVATAVETTIEAIAAEHVAAIERMIPAGSKLVLAGSSFGGTVAFEIARRLRASGDYDPLPVVIDMPALNVPGAPRRTRARQALDAARNLPRWMAHELTHFDMPAFATRARGHTEWILASLCARPRARKFDPRIYLARNDLPETLQELFENQYRALLRYVPGAFGGKLILLRAAVPSLFGRRDRFLGWEAVARGGVEVHWVPGTHYTCTVGAEGAVLSATVARCTTEFEGSRYQPVTEIRKGRLLTRAAL